MNVFGGEILIKLLRTHSLVFKRCVILFHTNLLWVIKLGLSQSGLLEKRKDRTVRRPAACRESKACKTQ